jgi:uncharacterized membrane-anchored protein
MKKLGLILFAAMCFAQWMVPAKMIYDSEQVLAEGTNLKFKTRPIDPSDPFRGKYITLNFESNFFEFRDSSDWAPGHEVFVTFDTDSLGFAVVKEAFHTPPESNTYLRTTIEYVYNRPGFYTAEIKLPFERFYVEESKASEAEQVYWESQRNKDQITYAVVSIGEGQAILQDVFINDRSIIDIVEDLNKDAE